MNDSGRDSAADVGRDHRIQDLARRMRDVLGQGDLETENHRKAALRRVLHEHAAGLTRDEIDELVASLRDRFPDRIFESDRSARSLAGRTEELEKEAAKLRAERDDLRKRVDHLDRLMGQLAAAAATPAGATAAPGAPRSGRKLDAAAQTALLEVAALLFSFALNQEETARSVEETLGGPAAGSAGQALATTFQRLGSDEALSPEDMKAVQRRLRALQLMPGALLTGVQQSWKGGTQEILEQLDPKSANTSILKYHLMLKDVEQRFEEFWKNLDRNIDHYYRGRFERVYRDKMEEGP